MNKVTKVAATAAILLVLPAAALAHNGQGNAHGWYKQAEKEHKQKTQNKNGTVSSVAANSFNITAKNGTTFTVNVSSSTVISLALGGTTNLAGVHVNDKAEVKGAVNGNQISASKVVIVPANTHRASGSGTVTAVNGNNITVSQTHGGVVSSFTAQVSAGTTIVNATNSTTSLSSITVGKKITVTGLWDEIANILKAVKIKIK